MKEENWITYKGKKYLSVQVGVETFLLFTESEVKTARKRGKKIYKEIHR